MWFLPKGHIPQSLLAHPCQMLMSIPCLDQWEVAPQSCSRSAQHDRTSGTSCMLCHRSLSQQEANKALTVTASLLIQGFTSVGAVHLAIECCASHIQHHKFGAPGLMTACHHICHLANSKCYWHHCPGQPTHANHASCALCCPALQGDKFTQALQCRFGNTSLTYIVNATVVDPQTAYCTSPQWYADNNTRVSFSASTSASDCWSGTEFAYYLDPQVSQVAPLSGPRYGSFELRVQLEETVCSFAEEVSLQWTVSMA